MAARPGPLWLLGLALCALSGGGPGPRPATGGPPRRLGPRERRDLQREILAVLGLPGRPRPRAPPAAARLPASAPLFMLDLYHAMAGDDDEDGGPHERRLGRADLVMSFVNMGECGLRVGVGDPRGCACGTASRVRALPGGPAAGTRAAGDRGRPRVDQECPRGGQGPAGDRERPGSAGPGRRVGGPVSCGSVGQTLECETQGKYSHPPPHTPQVGIGERQVDLGSARKTVWAPETMSKQAVMLWL